MVALHDLKEFLDPGQDVAGVIAHDIMRPPPPCLTPDQRLAEALPTILASEQHNILVVNSSAEMRLVGRVPRGEVLALLSQAIEQAATELG